MRLKRGRFSEAWLCTFRPLLPTMIRHLSLLLLFSLGVGMLVQANADKDLSFRNLAFSGDEVNTWQRVGDKPEDFGTCDQWLTKVGPSSIRSRCPA